MNTARAVLLITLFVSACGGAPTEAPAPDLGVTPRADAGTTMASDAGTIIPDAGSTTPDAGTTTPDAGTTTPDAGSTTPDAGSTTPDAGSTTPDAGSTTPDAGTTTPDAGTTTPDAGTTTPDAGSTTPDAGSTTPDAGTATPDAGTTTPDAGSTTPDAGTPDAGTVSGLPSVSATRVAVGWNHACAITSQGRIRCWGAADQGQLGNGVIDGSSSGLFAEPIEIASITSGATEISAFAAHSCAVVSGAVRCWGANDEGQLGNGSLNRSATPVNVSLPAGFSAANVAVGADFSCALSTGGRVLCWGKNDFGQLGHDSFDARSTTPVQPIGLGSGVVSLGAGAFHVCAALSSGGMRCWGSNLYGEQGIGVTGNGAHSPGDVLGLANITRVGAGEFYSCAISSAGAMWCWGRNGDGQLGNGQSGFNVDALLPSPVVGVSSGATAVSGGYGFGCGIITGGVRCWGSNYNLVLGNGGSPSDLYAEPVAVSGLLSPATSVAASASDHACAVAAGAVWCWGSAGPALGTGDVNTNAASPVRVLRLP